MPVRLDTARKGYSKKYYRKRCYFSRDLLTYWPYSPLIFNSLHQITLAKSYFKLDLKNFQHNFYFSFTLQWSLIKTICQVVGNLRSGPIVVFHTISLTATAKIVFILHCPPEYYYRAKRKLSLISGYGVARGWLFSPSCFAPFVQTWRQRS